MLLTVATLLALAGGVAGQPSTVDLSMQVEGAAGTLGPGNATTVQIQLTNDGSMDGTTTLDLSTEGDGWVAELSETEVALPAGTTETVELTFTAPSDHDAGADTVEATVSGTLQDASGQFTSTDQVTTGAQLTPPPPPPEPFPWVPVATGSTLALAAVAGGAWAWWRNRRESGIEVDAETTTTLRPGTEAQASVEVRNVSDRPRVAELDVTGIPEGFTAVVSLSEVELEPGEARRLWVAIQAPEDAEETRVELHVTAKPAEARTVRARAPLQIQVLEDARVPGSPNKHLIAPIGVKSPDPYEDARSKEELGA